MVEAKYNHAKFSIYKSNIASGPKRLSQGTGGKSPPLVGTARILQEDTSALGMITKSYAKEQDDVRFLYPQLA